MNKLPQTHRCQAIYLDVLKSLTKETFSIIKQGVQDPCKKCELPIT